MRLSLAFLFTFIFGSMFVSVRAARACGGGVVASTQSGTIGADAQRIFISVRGGTTDVITQIGVPQTTADYGVLIPVPSEPTLDATPVASAEIDKLFARTAPTIVVQASDDGGPGCGCGSAKDSGPSGAAQVSQPVTIGPVTAVTLTADTGAAINTWLADNGFALPASGQSIVDSYAGTGRYFIAIRRSDMAAGGGPTSVGVHFTLAGDERGLPLRFASIGAADRVSFTVLVAADEVVGPAAPFQTLTLTDLDAQTLRSSSYYTAITARISNQGGRAFLIEGTWTGAELAGGEWPSLQPFIDPSQLVTRLSTVMRKLDLDTDVVLNQPFSGTAPRERLVQETRGLDDRPKLAFGFGFTMLAFAAVGARRRPRR